STQRFVPHGFGQLPPGIRQIRGGRSYTSRCFAARREFLDRSIMDGLLLSKTEPDDRSHRLRREGTISGSLESDGDRPARRNALARRRKERRASLARRARQRHGVWSSGWLSLLPLGSCGCRFCRWLV